MKANGHKEQVNSASGASAPLPRMEPQRRLSLETALDLVLCGGFMTGFSLWARHIQPGFQPTTLATGLVGGALCVLWGVLGRRGIPCRRGAVATLVVAAGVFTLQAVQSWGASPEGDSKARMMTALMTMVVAFCGVTLANLAQAGKGA